MSKFPWEQKKRRQEGSEGVKEKERMLEGEEKRKALQNLVRARHPENTGRGVSVHSVSF